MGSEKRWNHRAAATALAIGITSALIAPATAFAAGDDGTKSGGGRENPRAIELTRQNAWVKAGPLQFGTEPLEAVQQAATDAAPGAGCEINAESATALTLAPTWPEVSPEGEPPSPMTLSRYDNQASLGDPEGRAEGLFFNPGVGMWQLDSAGLGNEHTAGTAIDSASAAKEMATYITGKYCDAVNAGSSEADARAKAWGDWHACDEGACEDTYNRALEGVTPVPEVKRHGGAEPRKCTFEGAEYDCLFVDPAKAQGANWWAKPDGGPAPVPSPFYVFTYEESGSTFEVRYWLAEDSGASGDVSASRKFGVNARDELTWANETTLCDTTANRGNC